MRGTNTILVLALISCPISSFAEDKKDARSLADEAASLAENSGKNGWVSDEVTVSMDDGKKKAKVKLFIHFKADKDKATGKLRLGTNQVATDRTFELMEKDGKRYIKIMEGKMPTKDPKGDPDPKLLATVEYTIKSDELTIKGGVIRQIWVGWDVDLTKGIAFKAAGR